MDMIENNFGFEALRVLQEAFHEFRTLHTHDVGGPIVHVGCGGELSAWIMPVMSTGLRLARAA